MGALFLLGTRATAFSRPNHRGAGRLEMASLLQDGSSHIKEGVVLTWSSHSLKLFSWTELSVLCLHWGFLLDQNSNSRSLFWWVFLVRLVASPTDRCFIFFIAVEFALAFFIVSEMDAVKVRGRGCTSIYPAIHFIPLRGLDYSGETKVIRIHVIPKIQQKKKKSLQTARAILSTTMLIHENLPSNFPLCSLTSFLMHV